MKKILALLIMCCLLCLTGCGNAGTEIKIENDPIMQEYLEQSGLTIEDLPQHGAVPQPQVPEVETPEVLPEDQPDSNPVIPEEPPVDQPAVSTGIKVESKMLENNIKLVCDQIDIDCDKITDMQNAGEWSGGSIYSFFYEDLLLLMYASTDDTVESIVPDMNSFVFDKYAGARSINQCLVDEKAVVKVKELAEETIRKELKISNGDNAFIAYQRIVRDYNAYILQGSVAAGDGQGEIAFEIVAEIVDGITAPILRLCTLGEKFLLDETKEIKNSELVVPVQQKAKPLHSGKNGFLLAYGELGKYGERQDVPGVGTLYLYHIPVGRYKVISKIPMGMIQLISHEGSFTAEVLMRDDIIKNIDIGSVDSSKEVVIQEGEYIILPPGARIVFESLFGQ